MWMSHDTHYHLQPYFSQVIGKVPFQPTCLCSFLKHLCSGSCLCGSIETTPFKAIVTMRLHPAPSALLRDRWTRPASFLASQYLSRHLPPTHWHHEMGFPTGCDVRGQKPGWGLCGRRGQPPVCFADATTAAPEPASSERLGRSTYEGVPGRAEPRAGRFPPSAEMCEIG